MKTYSYKRFGQILVAGLVISMSFLSAVFAQIGNLNKGDKIRIYAPSIEYDKIHGVIYDITPTAIFLNSNNFSLSVPIYAIQSLELNNGVRRNTGPGALIGVIGGAAVGGVIGLMSYEGCGNNESFCLDFSPGFYFLGGAAVGGLSGLVVGAIAGYWIKTDIWREVPINMEIGLRSYRFSEVSVSPGITLKVALDSIR